MNKYKQMARVVTRRRGRVRDKLRSHHSLRLSVHTTGKHIYAQVIDDLAGVTLAAASSCERLFTEKSKSGSNVEAAVEIGKIIAARAIACGVSVVIFDRGSRRFHGRVAAVANAARRVGLVF